MLQEASQRTAVPRPKQHAPSLCMHIHTSRNPWSRNQCSRNPRPRSPWRTGNIIQDYFHSLCHTHKINISHAKPPTANILIIWQITFEGLLFFYFIWKCWTLSISSTQSVLNSADDWPWIDSVTHYIMEWTATDKSIINWSAVHGLTFHLL